MTRGHNLRGHSPDRYRVEVRERHVEIRVWLPVRWSSATIREMLALIMAAAPTLADVPFKPSPAPRRGLYLCRLRVTAAQRGMIDVVATLHGVSISEAVRGIVAAWMEAPHD